MSFFEFVACSEITFLSRKYRARLKDAWLKLLINNVALPRPHSMGVRHVRNPSTAHVRFIATTIK